MTKKSGSNAPARSGSPALVTISLKPPISQQGTRTDVAADAERRLILHHRELEACRRCPKMIGPVVHGPPVVSRILLIGQAPGPREGSFGRPFAWTAGRTLFHWFEQAIGASEEAFRSRVYMAAVARCFPGKAKGGGDRRPDPEEILQCRAHLEREVEILRPHLILPVGGLAIEQVLGHKGPLSEVVGSQRRARYYGALADVIALPHPSGASSWHKTEPGISLLRQALEQIARHPEVVRTFGGAAAKAPDAR